jgi:hypothetical protein
MGQPAIAAEAGNQIATGYVDVTVADWQVRCTPFFNRFRQHAVAVSEERPGEKSLVWH